MGSAAGSGPLPGPDGYLAIDQAFHACFTLGLSPAALFLAQSDWWWHLQTSPGKQLELCLKAHRKLARLLAHLGQAPGAPPCIEPLPQDRRYSDPAWRQWPYSALYQSFLLCQQWWHNATTEAQGLRAP